MSELRGVDNSQPQPTAGSPAGDGPMVAIEAVSFSYQHGPVVLHGVSAAANAGRVCGLLGPNGAGKSTLVRLIMGMLKPSSGRLRICGKEPTQMSAGDRAATLAYVPQRGQASFAFTVEQVVNMARHALPRDISAVDHALERCDLTHLRQRIFLELSVGQQQRVLLARALAQAHGGGAVILLDEPHSAMDLRHTHETMALLRSLAADGLCVLAVLQDLSIAARYCDDIWLLKGGRLVAQGPWEQTLRPEQLEQVYGVPIRQTQPAGMERPLLYTQPRASGVE